MTSWPSASPGPRRRGQSLKISKNCRAWLLRSDESRATEVRYAPIGSNPWSLPCRYCSQRLPGYITEATGAIMVIGGILYGIRELMSESEDYEKEAKEKLAKGEGGLGKRFRYFAVLGGALSPDLTILPIFILAAPIGL